MNTPVTYNVGAPASAANAPVTAEKKESGGMFGWLGSLFGGSSTPAPAVGGRRRTRKGKGRKGRKGSRRNSRK